MRIPFGTILRPRRNPPPQIREGQRSRCPKARTEVRDERSKILGGIRRRKERGAQDGGIVSFASGCSSLTPSDKTQMMGVYAFGIPGIAVITQSHQTADNAGSDTNAATQSNPVEVSGK